MTFLNYSKYVNPSIFFITLKEKHVDTFCRYIGPQIRGTIFPTPRLPIIRMWGSREVYPEGLFVKSVEDDGRCFTFTEYMPEMPVQFVLDDSGNWTTATVGDFIFNLGGTVKEPVRGWIHIGSNSPLHQSSGSKGADTPLYTISGYSDGKKLDTKFGTYQGMTTDPAIFPDDSENYIAEMSDNEGHWLWLYRLYAPVGPA